MYYLCVCVSACVWIQVLWHMYRSQRVTCRGQFSPSAMCILRLNLRSSDLELSTSPCQALTSPYKAFECMWLDDSDTHGHLSRSEWVGASTTLLAFLWLGVVT